MPVFSLMFGRVTLNFSTTGILGLFAIFGFEVKKASLATYDILLTDQLENFLCNF